MGKAVGGLTEEDWRWGIPVCSYCLRKGHLAADCPTARKEREERDKLKCNLLQARPEPTGAPHWDNGISNQ